MQKKASPWLPPSLVDLTVTRPSQPKSSSHNQPSIMNLPMKFMGEGWLVMAGGIWLRRFLRKCRKFFKALPRTATPCTSLVPWLIDSAQLVNVLVEVCHPSFMFVWPAFFSRSRKDSFLNGQRFELQDMLGNDICVGLFLVLLCITDLQNYRLSHGGKKELCWSFTYWSFCLCAMPSYALQAHKEQAPSPLTWECHHCTALVIRKSSLFSETYRVCRLYI